MKTLKKIVTFYLGSWWLPQVVAWGWIIFSYFLIISWAVKYNIGDGALPRLALACSIFILLYLGWLASWIWLLFCKRWKRALWSFLFAVIPLLLLFFVAYLNTPS